MLDLEFLHDYFMQNNDFFKKIAKEKSKKDMFNIYRRLELKSYLIGHKLCVYGTEGHTFYIVIKGEAGVLVPIDQQVTFSSWYELLVFILENH